MARLNILPMAGGPRPRRGAPGGILDLLRLASDRPREALARAHEILATDPAPYEASVAHQSIGILLREWGDLDAATANCGRAAPRPGCRLRRTSGRRAGDTRRRPDLPGQQPPRAGGVGLVPQAGRPARRPGTCWSAGASRCRFSGGTRRLWMTCAARSAFCARRATAIWEARALTARALVHLACGATRQGRTRPGQGRAAVRHHQPGRRGRLHLAQPRPRRIPLRRPAQGAVLPGRGGSPVPASLTSCCPT